VPLVKEALKLMKADKIQVVDILDEDKPDSERLGTVSWDDLAATEPGAGRPAVPRLAIRRVLHCTPAQPLLRPRAVTATSTTSARHSAMQLHTTASGD
jgi:hypothetical protein